MRYSTLYDVGAEGMKHNWIIGLAFLAIGVLMLFYKVPDQQNTSSENGKLTFSYPKKITPIIAILFMVFGGLTFILTLVGGISQHNMIQEILKHKTYESIEGKVENYDRWTRGNNGTLKEEFSIDTLKFLYDEPDANYGYKPIKNKQILYDGMYVRVSYYWKGSKKIILKIERGR